MQPRILLALFFLFPLPALAEDVADAKILGSYFAIIVSDVDASKNWYQTVLGLQQVSRSTERDRYDIVNLAGPGLFVELLQLESAGARPGGQTEGPFKVGMLVDDLTSFAAALPAAAANAEIVYDRTNNVLVLQLRDPDDYMVQVMQLVEE